MTIIEKLKLKKLYPKSLQSIDDAKSRKIWNIHAGVEICAYMSWCIIRPPLVLTCCSKGKAPPDTRFANCVKICLQPWSVAWAEGKKIGGPQIGAHFISNPALQRAVAAYIQPHTKLPGFTSVASKYHSQLVLALDCQNSNLHQKGIQWLFLSSQS